MNPSDLPLDQVLEGDCLKILADFPPECADLIFADPPYNLQLTRDLWRPDLTRVEGVDEAWDQFSGFNDYDAYTRAWLVACRRVLKPTGALWVIGTYHNIYRVGAILQDLGFWILNNVVWVKTNPMPNFHGVRFTNAHETLIWAQKEHGQPYTFNYLALKGLNDGLQMRSDWYLPVCAGAERLRVDGATAHPAQKPLALLYRILLASTQPGDLVLDPFFGSGTTGEAARRLGRHWIGIERSPHYAELARRRIAATPAAPPESLNTRNRRREARIPFGTLVEHGLITPGQRLYFGKKSDLTAVVQADGQLVYNGQRGSIHQTARLIQPGPANGWVVWHTLDPLTGERQPIDTLREAYRALITPPLDNQGDS